MDGLVLGFRSLRANPGHSVVVVLTVALGVAATTTIVSFITPYLIRELPFELESSRSRTRRGWSR